MTEEEAKEAAIYAVERMFALNMPGASSQCAMGIWLHSGHSVKVELTSPDHEEEESIDD